MLQSLFQSLNSTIHKFKAHIFIMAKLKQLLIRFTKQKILVVDDEQRIRDLIGQYIMVEGYDVEYAKDGIDALTKISKGDIDLVILDVMMPFMDGISCLREMRSRGFKTPVIILSAKGEEYDKITGFDAGTDDYVVKPFSARIIGALPWALICRCFLIICPNLFCINPTGS